MTPSYIAEFCPVAATHYWLWLRSVYCGDLVFLRNCLELDKRAFAVTGPTVWNNLTLSVRLLLSITTFKTALKTHLFNGEYDASKYQWLAYASTITICFCKAPLRCLHLWRFITCQYHITLQPYGDDANSRSRALRIWLKFNGPTSLVIVKTSTKNDTSQFSRLGTLAKSNCKILTWCMLRLKIKDFDDLVEVLSPNFFCWHELVYQKWHF